jgi:hypothetical protein
MILLYNKYLITVFIIVITAVVGIISIKFLGNDNVIKEACEDVIQKEVGIDVDLSKEAPQAQTPASLSSNTPNTPPDSSLGTSPGETTHP